MEHPRRSTGRRGGYRGHAHDQTRGHAYDHAVGRARGHVHGQTRGFSSTSRRDVAGSPANLRIEKKYQAKMIITQVSADNLALCTKKCAPYDYAFSPDNVALNAAKDALGTINTDGVGKSREYRMFRQSIDMYADLRREILRVGGEKNASNAFLKCYELIYTFMRPILDSPSKPSEITGFFNAELPGSSMVAFNHFMRTLYPEVAYKWFASSLWSTELVEGSYGLEDQYGYVAHNPNNWLMNDTNNGDMTVPENILDIAARIGPKSEVGGVDVAWHDAGIDVSGAESGEVRFDIQEDSNMWLHLGCALAAFLTLKTGPQTVFIAKQYTYYHTFTWNLILLYSTLFDSFYLTKPLTSRPTNSEIYLVGIGFKGIPSNLVNLMLDRMKRRDSSPLYEESAICMLPAMHSLCRFVSIVYGQQVDMLNELVTLHRTYTPAQLSSGLHGLRRQLIEHWLTKYPVKRIDADKRVPSN